MAINKAALLRGSFGKKAEAKKPGFLQGLAQTIGQPFARAGSNIVAGVEGGGELGAAALAALRGDKSGAQQHINDSVDATTRERDFGYFGSGYPVGQEPDGNTLDGMKDIVGTGMQIGSYLAPVGIGRGASSLGQAVMSGAGRGALQGGLATSGKAISDDASLKEGLISTGVGAAAGGAIGGALSGLQYSSPQIMQALKGVKNDQRGSVKLPGGKGYNGDEVGDMMAWEDGSLDEEGTTKLFQHLVDTGKAWKLQGSYGRQAQALIDGGYVTPPKPTSPVDDVVQNRLHTILSEDPGGFPTQSFGGSKSPSTVPVRTPSGGFATDPSAMGVKLSGVDDQALARATARGKLPTDQSLAAEATVKDFLSKNTVGNKKLLDIGNNSLPQVNDSLRKFGAGSSGGANGQVSVGVSDIAELSKLYKAAVASGEKTFKLRGSEVLTDYAKYLLEYLKSIK